MKLNMKAIILSAVLVLFTSAALAQDNDTDKGKSKVRTVTGCLSKGDGANEYLLTGKNGSSWEVRSDKVALADHVGHTVTATGTVNNATMHNMKEDAKDAAADAHMKKSNNEHGHMEITSVKHVSESCKK
jgi:hypothetical protein